MNQPYIGNTKITKLYKGSEIWCNWIKSEPEIPGTPTIFDTIIFCQNNNNIITNGEWSFSSYTCYTGTKSLFTNDKTASIASNVINLPIGTYEWSMYFSNSVTSILAFSVEGDYSAEVNIKPENIANSVYNTIMTFNITSPSNIILKLSAKNSNAATYCRFFDWKLEKIS